VISRRWSAISKGCVKKGFPPETLAKEGGLRIAFFVLNFSTRISP